MPGSSKRLSRLAAWADEGKLRPTVAQTFAFDEAGVRGAFEARAVAADGGEGRARRVVLAVHFV